MGASVICGMQWGDEGKGKVIDFLAPRADYVVRYQGGNNAGHTVIAGGEKFVLHLLPSGVLNANAKCFLAPGVLLDPRVLLEEMDALSRRGVPTNHIYISERAHLIMPYHVRLDELKEESLGAQKIGTTKRGIGPCYMDKYERSGIRACEMLDKKRMREHIYANTVLKNEIIEKIYGQPPLDAEAICNAYDTYADLLANRIIDTTAELHQALKNGKNVLFEGAQALMLDIDHGNYPYVTSSSPSAGAVCTGAGIAPQWLETRIGVFKAYATKVGEGPFPTELLDATGEKIRAVGGEYGSTTKRPRRTGWLDLAALKYAANINGCTELAMMKMDVLSGLGDIPLCIGYEIAGQRDDRIHADAAQMAKVQPIYKVMPGWHEDLSSIREYNRLPDNARAYIDFIEQETEVKIKTVSVGPDREQTILRP